MFLMTATAANAGGLVTKHSSSVQLTVDAARSTAVRIGSSYSTSGSGIVTDVGGSGTADLNVGSLSVSSGVGNIWWWRNSNTGNIWGCIFLQSILYRR